MVKFEVRQKEFLINHLGKNLIFENRFTEGTYNECAQTLNGWRLSQPTFSQIVSLLHSAYKNEDNEDAKKMTGLLLIKKSLRCFTGLHYVPEEGVYIQDNPQIINGRVFMNRENLVKKLEANNSSVRFVPFGYKTDIFNYKTDSNHRHKALKLKRNKLILGLCGVGDDAKEQADKLAEIADSLDNGDCGYEPFFEAFESTNKKTTRVSVLAHQNLGYGFNIYATCEDDNDRVPLRCRDLNLEIEYVGNNCIAFGLKK